MYIYIRFLYNLRAYIVRIKNREGNNLEKKEEGTKIIKSRPTQSEWQRNLFIAAGPTITDLGRYCDPAPSPRARWNWSQFRVLEMKKKTDAPTSSPPFLSTSFYPSHPLQLIRPIRHGVEIILTVFKDLTAEILQFYVRVKLGFNQ